jgi:hypothetical protein
MCPDHQRQTTRSTPKRNALLFFGGNCTRRGEKIEKHYCALLRVFKEDKEQAQQELERYQHVAVKRAHRPSNDDQDGGTKNDDRKKGDVDLVAHTEDSPKKITKNTFLGDTGASTHMGNHDEACLMSLS